jgi:hypothetical protein
MLDFTDKSLQKAGSQPDRSTALHHLPAPHQSATDAVMAAIDEGREAIRKSGL